ncbi:sorbosone dehydrogenase family protein [Bacillus sp. S/N-304-OC-R1]|uniref:PQQ-dependent sugar dehydrogenase n=1 Tax=Bacillus sp. S/N-304-OC-R1 TaxID=2758034 RepID=UPI001C8E49D1|nr:sorbosone dehydrogenase family protein [Bacillus sp. S/N-304-OC-R1]MBY0123385.1 sorbosone dehydrogenase family protein [Bacillus sp. S/N-304-OC-R1]
MARIAAILLLAVVVMTGCSNVEKREEVNREAAVPISQPQVLADDLQIPWSIAMVEDVIYLSERPGTIVKIEDGKTERQRVELEKPLATAAEAGLLGFLLSPDFLQTNEAFAYYTYSDQAGQFNRIVVLQFENNVWQEKRLLLDKIPSGQYHHGGRLKIGPDGKLYATTGDAAANPEIAQDLGSLGGKILRMNLDGSIPHDNPYPDSFVYSYGHRNPQGLAWTSDGELYESEHGPSANDEINQIYAGKNYGWPIIKGKEKRSGMETPLFTSGANHTWAPSGMAYANGKLYVAALRGSAVLEYNVQTGKQREIITGLGRNRDVYITDHHLYFISNNTDGRGNPQTKDDKLYRIPLTAQ